MSKEDLLKDLEELAADLKANAERADDKTEAASLNSRRLNSLESYLRGFYRGCSVSDKISSNSLRHIIKKYTT